MTLQRQHTVGDPPKKKKKHQHKKSETTGWTIEEGGEEYQEPVVITSPEPESGEEQHEKVIDIKGSKGLLVIDYDMEGKPDRMRIEDAETGEKLYDTIYRRKNENHIEKEIDLGDRTKIRVLINPNRPSKESVFDYKIEFHQKMEIGGKGMEKIIDHAPRTKLNKSRKREMKKRQRMIKRAKRKR